MAPKRWMFFTWIGIILAFAAICAVYGGQNCEVPKSGPFHWLLSHRVVQRFAEASRYSVCHEIR